MLESVVEVVIEPGGVLLTPSSPSQKLVATAFDADGNEVPAEITWESNDEGEITVDVDGTVRRNGASSSALITARVGDARATVFALAATPVAGAMEVSDTDVTDGPFAEDSSAPFAEGFRYSIELGVEPPDEGRILLTRGAKPIAGRVVAVNGASVELEVVPLDAVFAELVVNESLRLEEVSGAAFSAPPSAFQVGPFECKTDTGVVALEFPKKTAIPSGLDTLRYDLIWERAQKKLEVSGNPHIDFEFQPTLAAAFEGSVTCKMILKEYPIPIPGPAKLFLGAAVVVGGGVQLGGKIPVAGVGVNLKGDVAADFAMGAACSDDAGCTTIQKLETAASVTPTLVAPEVSVKFEPSAQLFAFVDFEGGARFSTTLRTEAIQARGGFKLAGSFATEETQVEDPAYASKYELSAEAEVGPGEAVNDFFRLIGFGLSFLKFETSERLAGSPTGRAETMTTGFSAGDDVTFDVSLDPETVLLPVVGYNVEKVRIYRREARASGGTALILANEQVAEPDQTRFSIPWVATVDGSVEGNFVTFVTTKLIGLPLEVGAVSSLARAGTLVSGGTYNLPVMQLNDGYVVNLPAGVAENGGDNPLTVARVFYSTSTDRVEVCAQPRMRTGLDISINIAAEGGLAAGTYPYADWSMGVIPGTFTTLITRHDCQSSEGGTGGCECNPTDLPGGYTYQSGELQLTAVPGMLRGTFVLVEAPTLPQGTGDFALPVCLKTPEEHAAIRAGRYECVP